MDSRNPTSFRSSPVGRAGNNWQDEAKYYIEKVGELEYYVSWRAASASRCRMTASALDDQGAPTGSLDPDDPNAQRVQEIVQGIAGGVSGQIKIMHRAAYLLSSVGECWIGVVLRDASREISIDGPGILPVDLNRPGYELEQWYVFGRDEIKAGNNTVELKLPDGTRHTLNPDVDVLFRVWDEHPFDPSKPVSPIWSNRDTLAGIVQADATIKASNNSRLNGNGVMFVPQEMSLPDQAAPAPLPLGQTDTNEPDPFFEPNSAQKLQDLLYDVAAEARRDPNSAAAQNPIIAAVPGELIKYVAWLRAGTDVPETTLKIEEFDIRRLATGLHVAPERLLGMSEGNHWSGWLIDEMDVKVHIAPVVEIVVTAFTQEVLREKLALEGIDPNAYIVWYDSSALTQDPDKTDEAKDAFDRGVISSASLRLHFGFDEEDGYDFSTADGWVQFAIDRIGADATNAAMFLPILEQALGKLGLEMASPQAALPAADAEDEEDPADAEPEEPDSDPADEDPAPPVQAAAMTVARLCVNRALELANKRRRTRADHGRYRDVPIELAHTVLDPVSMTEAADLVKGWSSGLTDEDLVGLHLSPASFRSMVEGVAGLALVTSSAPVLTPSMLRRIT